MKGVVDRYLRAVGIVTEGVSTPISTALSPAVASTSTTPPGSPPVPTFSCPCGSSPRSARGNDDPHDQLKRAAAKRWVVFPRQAPGQARCRHRSRHDPHCKPPFAGPDQVLAATSPATPIASRCPTTGCSPSTRGRSPSTGRNGAHGNSPLRHPGGCGLSAPLSASRPARPLRAHPPLWLARQRGTPAAPAHGARAAGAVDPRCLDARTGRA